MKKQSKHPVLNWLKANAIAGLLVTLPVILTFYIFSSVVTKLDALLIPIIPLKYRPEALIGLSIPGTGVVAGLILMIVIGLIARNFFGKKLVALGDAILHRVPFINWLYSTLKQIIDTVASSQKETFRQVVMVEYPRKGIWCMAFVTGVTKGEVQNVTKDEMVNVFLPTTPNPTSGFLLFIPKKDTIPLAMTVEEGTKMIISGGIITPPLPVTKNTKK